MNHYLVYVACHTRETDGLRARHLDMTSGAILPLYSTAEGVAHCLFVEIDPAGRFLFAADDVKSGGLRKGEAVSSYSIDRDSGRLTF